MVVPMRHLRVTGGVLAVCILLAACQQAVMTKEPEPQPQPTAAELLRGSWRFSEPWTEDDTRIGMRIVTLTFTQSRWIRQMSYVYDDGEPQNPWANGSSGSWSATDDAVTMTAYHEHEDELIVDEPVSLEYFWVDVGTELLLQSEDDAVAINEYSRYRKTGPVAPPTGSRTFAFENEEAIIESWTMMFDGTDFRWVYRPNPQMAYETTGTVADVDQDEMFVTVNLTEDGEETGVTWRFAYAAGYADDALAVSPYWDEGLEDEETGHVSYPHPLRPYGNYWMLMRRDAE